MMNNKIEGKLTDLGFFVSETSRYEGVKVTTKRTGDLQYILPDKIFKMVKFIFW